MSLTKSRLVFEIVRHYAQTNSPITLAKLQQIFPAEIVGQGFNVVEAWDKAQPENFKGHKRYMVNADQKLNLDDGPAAVCNQWKIGNIEKFIARATELGYVISSTEDDA